MSPIKGQDTPTTQSAKIATTSHRSLLQSGKQPTEGHSGHNLDYLENTNLPSAEGDSHGNLMKINTTKAQQLFLNTHTHTGCWRG